MSHSVLCSLIKRKERTVAQIMQTTGPQIRIKLRKAGIVADSNVDDRKQVVLDGDMKTLHEKGSTVHPPWIF